MWGDDDSDEETQQVEEKKEEKVVVNSEKKEDANDKQQEEDNKTNDDDGGWGGGDDEKENGPTEKEKEEAAAKIQAVQRGNAARQELREKQEAATKIQAIQRGKVARKEVEELAEQKKQEEKDGNGNGSGGGDWGDDGADEVNSDAKEKEPEKVIVPVKPARKERDTASPRAQESAKPVKPAKKPKSAGKPVQSGDKVYVVSHRERTFEQAKVGQARIKQRTLKAPSSELYKKSCLKRLKLPLGIPSIPIILVIGDLASLDDDPQRKMLDYFTQGILRAAASVGALVVDSGLASGPCNSAPTPEYVDFVRKVCILGISPDETNEPLSRYHTHQLVVSDYQGFEKQQTKFVKDKLGMVRRLAGKCRVVGVFVNNGHTAFSEIVEFTRLNFPTVVVEGSGDLADELCGAIDSGRSDNLHVKEMLGTNMLMKLNSDCKPADLAALLQLCLTVDLVGLNAMAK